MDVSGASTVIRVISHYGRHILCADNVSDDIVFVDDSAGNLEQTEPDDKQRQRPYGSELQRHQFRA